MFNKMTKVHICESQVYQSARQIQQNNDTANKTVDMNSEFHPS
jgi:hypothetical protein